MICDVFTDVPLAGNQLCVFTDAREIPEELLQPLAREINFSETVFVYPPPSGGARPDPDLHARRTSCRSPATRCSARPSSSPGRCSSSRSASRPAMGIVPVALERERARIVFGRMSQPVPTVAPYAARGRAARRARRRALGPAGRGLRQRHAARLRRARERGGGCGAAARPRRARAPRARGAPIVGFNCFAGDGRALEDADVRAGRRRPRGSRDRLGGGSARLPSGPPRADRRSARRSRSRRAPRSAARARSTRGSRDRPSGSSGSRSADAPSSSPAASSGCSAPSLRARPVRPTPGRGYWRRGDDVGDPQALAGARARARGGAGPRSRRRTRCSCGSRQRASAARTCTSSAGTSGRSIESARRSRLDTSSPARSSRPAASSVMSKWATTSRPRATSPAACASTAGQATPTCAS